jgi:serine/threonine protein phosphatase PrpC
MAWGEAPQQFMGASATLILTLILRPSVRLPYLFLPSGDSHAFLVDSYGSAKRLSTPHDLTNEDEVARVLSAGGHIISKPGRKPRLYNKPRPYYGDIGALMTR